jgi:3D (Asp-Asp-Asp) domain-containing protein
MTKSPLIQRIGKAGLTGLCSAMAIGLIGAVAVRGMDRPEPAVTPAPAPLEMLYSLDKARHVEVTKRKSHVVTMEVTGYCSCKKCCGEQAAGITASGKKVSYNRGRFVAADTRILPFGTKVSIPGYHEGVAVEVIDRGGAIKGNKLDLYFPTHQAALNWGRRMVKVRVFD